MGGGEATAVGAGGGVAYRAVNGPGCGFEGGEVTNLRGYQSAKYYLVRNGAVLGQSVIAVLEVTGRIEPPRLDSRSRLQVIKKGRIQ